MDQLHLGACSGLGGLRATLLAGRGELSEEW